MKVLVTGDAGFIGFHTARRLLERGDEVVGFDCVNDYYDPSLQEARLAVLDDTARQTGSPYAFVRASLADHSAVEVCFTAHNFDRVIHLAAQAGVRYSIDIPHAYVDSSIVAFTNILKACRHGQVGHLTYASTSSVYGANTSMPFREDQPADHPLQFYAATKRANELKAHSYSHLLGLPTAGLRFFTVYGPWGRTDMALFLLTRAILAGASIQLFNGGNHVRDFTYVDDIVEGIVRASDSPAMPAVDWEGGSSRPEASSAPWRIFNVGNANPVPLLDYVAALEKALGKTAIRQLRPLQAGDVVETFASSQELEKALGYHPSTPVNEGVRHFVDWYLSNQAMPNQKTK